jgi:phosphatidylglycerophosphate synthase
MKWLTLPNLLSLSRLPLAAAFLLVDSRNARIAIVTAVAITDLADGFLARRMASHDRKSGQLIDPITDKLFVVIAFVAFTVRGDISVPTLALILARDIYTTFAYIILKRLQWPYEFKSRVSGKLVTVLQLAVLLALLFWQAALEPLLWVLAAASLFAILDYSRVALRQRLADPGAGA